MANYRQAPKLFHNKDKYKSTNFYQLPQGIMDKVFTQLDGKCGNQIKLMCVLLGTIGDGSFGISEAWVQERTGMIQQTYNKSRQALVEKGWLYVDDGKIFILIDNIMNEGTTSE